ncbi:hypothetical protein KZ773_02175 [Escherichia coli]|nr:hypothetical protein [Escherichia coli]
MLSDKHPLYNSGFRCILKSFMRYQPGGYIIEQRLVNHLRCDLLHFLSYRKEKNKRQESKTETIDKLSIGITDFFIIHSFVQISLTHRMISSMLADETIFFLFPLTLEDFMRVVSSALNDTVFECALWLEHHPFEEQTIHLNRLRLRKKLELPKKSDRKKHDLQTGTLGDLNDRCLHLQQHTWKLCCTL